MKICSWNVNGIRAVHKKGALDAFLKVEDPDVLLLQEIKAKEEQLDDSLTDDTYLRIYHPAEKPGYAGTAIFVNQRLKDKEITFSTGMPDWNDTEGRVAQCTIDKQAIITVYVPNGGKSDDAYQEKLRFFTTLATYAQTLQRQGLHVVIAGDCNVARSDLDLTDPEKHYNNHTHFNDEVCAHMEALLDTGLVDTYRSRYPQEKGAFSYWDNFSFSLPKGIKPRDVNKGWRLDYILVDAATDKHVTDALIHQNIFGSDHCPVSIYL